MVLGKWIGYLLHHVAQANGTVLDGALDSSIHTWLLFTLVWTECVLGDSKVSIMNFF